MASFKLIILENTVSELEKAKEYYNQQIDELGVEFEEEIYSVLDLIKVNPLLFPIKFAHIHEAVIKRFPFVINYEIDGSSVIILSIFHTKQNPKKKLKKKK
jgi:plasmid stabilization system protein ParE